MTHASIIQNIKLKGTSCLNCTNSSVPYCKSFFFKDVAFCAKFNLSLEKPLQTLFHMKHLSPYILAMMSGSLVKCSSNRADHIKGIQTISSDSVLFCFVF